VTRKAYNPHSRKSVHHVAAVSFHFYRYNMIHPHTTQTAEAGGRIQTPAMAAGLATAPYAFDDMIDLIR